MSEMVYKWREKSHIKIDAQKAGETMEMLRTRNNGRLTQKIVLDDARSKASILHSAFEWDDAVAGEKYRLDQAGHLIRSITVDVKVPKQEKTKPVRAFVNVLREDDQSYTSVAHAMSDAELRQQVISRAWAELQSWRKRYSEYEELASIFASIDGQTLEDLTA